MEVLITNIDRADGNDLTAQFTMRYRLESDPDVDASYTAVATTQTYLGITYPYFDATAMAPGVYVIHTYYTTEGPTTGTKITVNIDNPV